MLHDDDGNDRVRQDTVQLPPIPVQSRPGLGHHLGNGEPEPDGSLDDTGDLPVKLRLLTETGIRPSFAQAHAGERPWCTGAPFG